MDIFPESIIIHDFVFEHKHYLLNESIVLNNIYDSINKIYYYHYDLLNIYLYAREIEIVKEDFYEQFTDIYNFLINKKDKKLTNEALEVKKQLLNLIKNVEKYKTSKSV